MVSWRLSARAEADLLAIYLYGLENFGRSRAVDYIESVEGCFDQLAVNPRIGRKAEAAGAGVRRFEHRRHVAFYELNDGRVLILAVIHERSVRRLDL